MQDEKVCTLLGTASAHNLTGQRTAPAGRAGNARLHTPNARRPPEALHATLPSPDLTAVLSPQGQPVLPKCTSRGCTAGEEWSGCGLPLVGPSGYGQRRHSAARAAAALLLLLRLLLLYLVCDKTALRGRGGPATLSFLPAHAGRPMLAGPATPPPPVGTPMHIACFHSLSGAHFIVAGRNEETSLSRATAAALSPPRQLDTVSTKAYSLVCIWSTKRAAASEAWAQRPVIRLCAPVGQLGALGELIDILHTFL